MKGTGEAGEYGDWISMMEAINGDLELIEPKRFLYESE